MTDEEILFDFYTISEHQDALKKQQLESYESDTETQAESKVVEPPLRVVPENPFDQNRTKSTQVAADRAEFIRWYEAEVGPWQTQPSTR